MQIYQTGGSAKGKHRFLGFFSCGLLIGSRCKKFHSDKVCRDRKCVTVAAGKQRRRRPDETDTGGLGHLDGVNLRCRKKIRARKVFLLTLLAAAARRNERFLTLRSAKARGAVNGFHVRASEQETQRRRGRVTARIKKTLFSPLCLPHRQNPLN